MIGEGAKYPVAVDYQSVTLTTQSWAAACSKTDGSRACFVRVTLIHIRRQKYGQQDFLSEGQSEYGQQDFLSEGQSDTDNDRDMHVRRQKYGQQDFLSEGQSDTDNDRDMHVRRQKYGQQN